MIKGDRDVGGAGEELEKPCHYIFDLVVSSEGVITSAYNLQTESKDKIPEDAYNIRPIHVGSVIKETYNLADPEHPRPIREIHTHEGPEDGRGAFGFRWTTTREQPMSIIDGLIFKIKHPVVRD